MNKKQKQIITVIAGAGLAYYFLVYLPEQEKQEQERLRMEQEETQRKEEERQQADLDAAKKEKQKEQETLKKLENIKKKKLHWRRDREVKSWTDNWLLRKKESFEKTLNDLGGEENINIFDVAADYTIHFPP